LTSISIAIHQLIYVRWLKSGKMHESKKINSWGPFNNYVAPRGLGSSHGDRPISMVALNVSHDSVRDAGG